MELALSEGRLSKWESLLDELQPHQLTVLKAFYQLNPWGEARADLREAVMATSISCAMAAKPVPKHKAAERVEALQHYLHGKQPEPASQNALAAAMKARFPSRSK